MLLYRDKIGLNENLKNILGTQRVKPRHIDTYLQLEWYPLEVSTFCFVPGKYSYTSHSLSRWIYL